MGRFGDRRPLERLRQGGLARTRRLRPVRHIMLAVFGAPVSRRLPFCIVRRLANEGPVPGLNADKVAQLIKIDIATISSRSPPLVYECLFKRTTRRKSLIVRWGICWYVRLPLGIVNRHREHEFVYITELT